ncbi:MAG: VOC family protein [Cyclobacteriaceae bacterium]
MNPKKFQIEGMTMAVTIMKPMLDFYSGVFDVSFTEKSMFNSKLYQGKLGDLNLLFCPAEVARNSAKQNRHQFDIVVEDIEASIKLATGHGGKPMGDIAEENGVLSVGIYDPDNNSILFKQYKTK